MLECDLSFNFFSAAAYRAVGESLPASEVEDLRLRATARVDLFDERDPRRPLLRDSGLHDLFEMLGQPSKLTSIDVSQNEASAQAMLVLEAALLGTASSLLLIQLDANPLGFDRG